MLLLPNSSLKYISIFIFLAVFWWQLKISNRSQVEVEVIGPKLKL